MADDIAGDKEEVEAPTTDSPESESEEQNLEAGQPEEEASEQESPESETGENEVGETPKDNAAWAKMRTENKRLRDALDSVDPKYLESLRNATAPENYPNQQIPQVSGDADYSQVTQGLNWAAKQAAEARSEASKLRQQIELQQDREAERAFPELKSDRAFQQIVAEKKLAARVLGHDRTTYEIAAEVAKLLGKREEQIAVQAAEKTKAQILQRQAISSEPKGQTTGGRSATSNEDLRMRVRKGDSKAQEEVAKGIIADLQF